jgi:hypothetical protein
MTQPERSALTSAALDYDTTIIGALELSEKKWVLAVQLPGVKRHTRHVLGASGKELATLIERLEARCGATGHPIARVILTHEAGRERILAGAISDATRRRSPCDAAFEPSRRSPGTAGEDGCHRRRDAVAHVDGMAAGRASRLFDGSNP